MDEFSVRVTPPSDSDLSELDIDALPGDEDAADPLEEKINVAIDDKGDGTYNVSFTAPNSSRGRIARPRSSISTPSNTSARTRTRPSSASQTVCRS